MIISTASFYKMTAFFIVILSHENVSLKRIQIETKRTILLQVEVSSDSQKID